MKKAIRIFEPVTNEQLKQLHSAPTWAALKSIVVRLAGRAEQ